MATHTTNQAGGTAVRVDDPAADHLHDRRQIIEDFKNFLVRSDYSNTYLEKIEQMVENRVFRLLVDAGDLRGFSTTLVRKLIARPAMFLEAFTEGLKDVTLAEHGDQFLRKPGVKWSVGFVGSFGANQVTPRGLVSTLLGQLVCIEGIVTKMSIIRPKMQKLVQYCPATNKHHVRSFRDASSLDGLQTKVKAISKQDTDGNKLFMDFGHCIFKDFQTLVVQEMPERAPLGQLPRSVDVLLDNDLVDSCKPGDRVLIVGVFRAFGTKNTFRGKVIANSVQTIGKEIQGLVMTTGDLQNIRRMSQRGDIFELISRSLAPCIYGHEVIKKALLLQLIGGMERNLENGTHLRGDINILMVGDPSTAKSQLLRFVMSIAPLAVSTTGRGSSGVGLTAAVTTDPDTKERRLEAGAMVLADRGVVCIDEFDKMNTLDRVAIHEVMEQQTVTIAKAGIHASLNARCSVIAAANPMNGLYDKNMSLIENVNLPDSLMSRFDLLFIVLDNLNPERDSAIANHVLNLHRYQRPGLEGVPLTNSSSIFDDEDEEREDMTTPVFQKFNPLLHGGFADGDGQRDELLNPEFIKKYIHYAKSRIKPTLSEVACELIGSEYANLRSIQAEKTLPVTARQLESIVRLATAHAKVRLSEVVEEVDTLEALKVVKFALFNDTTFDAADSENEEEIEATVRRTGDSSSDDDSDDSSTSGSSSGSDSDDALMSSSKAVWKKKKKKRSKNRKLSKPKKKKAKTADDKDDDDDDSEDEETYNQEIDETSERFKRVSALIIKLFKQARRRTGDSTIDFTEFFMVLKQDITQTKMKAYSKAEVEAMLRQLEDGNKIMYREGKIIQV